MKTLAPCCATAEGIAAMEDDYFVLLIQCGSDEHKHEVCATFCPWCGKRFEVVEAR